MLEALRSACAEAPQESGPGLTSYEIQTALGWTVDRAGKELRRLARSGRLQTRRVYRMACDGARRPVPVYWIE